MAMTPPAAPRIGTGPAEAGSPLASRIVVLRALGLGDLLTAVPALRGLRAHFPRHRLLLAAPRTLEGVEPLMGAFDELLPSSGTEPPPWSGASPDLAVNLHGSGPESIDALRELRPARLWSHAHPDCPELSGPEWQPETHEVLRWCRLLDQHGVRTDPSDLYLRVPVAPSPRPGAVVLHPGAAHQARRWPEERYARVAQWLAARGAEVVLTGSAAERPAAARVARLAELPETVVLAGQTGIGRLAALVAGATLVLSGDTGVAHLATAYRTPSVTLFGPVSPATWGPCVDHARHECLWAGREGDPFGATTDPGLLEISSTRVTAAVERVLAGQLGETATRRSWGLPGARTANAAHPPMVHRGAATPERVDTAPRRRGPGRWRRWLHARSGMRWSRAVRDSLAHTCANDSWRAV